MPEITQIKTISKQTHLNREPLKSGIIQAPRPCKQQMRLSGPDIGDLAGFMRALPRQAGTAPISRYLHTPIFTVAGQYSVSI